MGHILDLGADVQTLHDNIATATNHSTGYAGGRAIENNDDIDGDQIDQTSVAPKIGITDV